MSAGQYVPRLPIPEEISYAVWFYLGFRGDFRDVEEAMAARGVLVSYETVQRWCDEFGDLYAAGLRKRRRANREQNGI